MIVERPRFGGVFPAAHERLTKTKKVSGLISSPLTGFAGHTGDGTSGD